MIELLDSTIIADQLVGVVAVDEMALARKVVPRKGL